MQNSCEDIGKLLICTCLRNNIDIEIEDLQDADFLDPECPIHGSSFKIVEM